MRFIFSFCLLVISWTLLAQDTLQVMQYNLLQYGNYFGDCTSSTNNVNTKNMHLRTITQYVQPDIFTVNELSENTSYHQMILDQVLNIDGVNKYRKAVSFNFADSYLVNMLYFNSQKLALHSQDVVHSDVRDIDVYTLYYKAGDLAQSHDTVFITCFVAHLKAGNTDYNANQRGGMVASAMTYIRTHDLPGNLLFMGDLNIYTSAEQAYTNLTYTYNGIRYFYDPINREGHWNNNSEFQDVHTQSTHANNTDCFSSGGMDDRFDWIMASESLLNGTEEVLLLTDTYQALGNDGQHFNRSITDGPENTSAPSEVIDALYGMSDHLPVLVRLKINAALGIEEVAGNISSVRFANPSKGYLNYRIQLEELQSIKVEIFDLFGRLQYQEELQPSSNSLSGQINLNQLADGFYLWVATDDSGKSFSSKFLLKK